MTSPSSREDLIADVIDRYLSGESIRSVATSLNRSYGLVQGILKEAGVTIRPPGSGGRRTARPAPAEAGAKRDVAMVVHPSAGLPLPAVEVDDEEVVEQPKRADKEMKIEKAKKAERPKKGKKGKPAEKAKKAEKPKKAKKAEKPKKAKKSEKPQKSKKDRK